MLIAQIDPRHFPRRLQHFCPCTAEGFPQGGDPPHPPLASHARWRCHIVRFHYICQHTVPFEASMSAAVGRIAAVNLASAARRADLCGILGDVCSVARFVSCSQCAPLRSETRSRSALHGPPCDAGDLTHDCQGFPQSAQLRRLCV